MFELQFYFNEHSGLPGQIHLDASIPCLISAVLGNLMQQLQSYLQRLDVPSHPIPLFSINYQTSERRVKFA